MDYQIIRITLDNTSILDAIAEDVFDDVIQPHLLTAYLADPKNFMLVAVSDGVVIGQTRGMHHLQPDRATELYVDNLGVSPAHQRKGVATALMKALLEVATGDGIEDVWLGTEHDNEQAIGFYRSMGLLETRMVLFANYEDD